MMYSSQIKRINSGKIKCANKYSNLRLLPSQWRHYSILTLAIESSCDDTSVAILEVNSDGPLTEPRDTTAKLHFHARQTANSAAYRGIQPSLAAKSHQLFLRPLIQQALEDGLPDVNHETNTTTISPSGSSSTAIPIRCSKTGTWKWKRKPDLIAVTRGPGMSSSLSAGVGVAQGLSCALQVPLVGVHHMLGHAWTPGLCYALGLKDEVATGFGAISQGPSEFPSYSLLISGGHTMLVYSDSPSSHKILTDTVDTAIGDALDKMGRLVLPEQMLKECTHTSYGALLENFAFPSLGCLNEEMAGTPERYADVYQPPFPSRFRSRRTNSTWGWSFCLPFADKSRRDVFDSVTKLSVRNKISFPGMENGPTEFPVPFSFTGLVSSVERFVKPGCRRVWNNDRNGFDIIERSTNPIVEGDNTAPVTLEERRALAGAVLTTAFETLAETVVDGIALHRSQLGGLDWKSSRPIPLILAGGVSANLYLRYILQSYISARTDLGEPIREDRQQNAAIGQTLLPVELTLCPAPSTHRLARQLCTDNAVMIAWAGVWMHQLGIHMSEKKDQELLEMANLTLGMADSFGAVASRWSLEELETRRMG